MHAGRHRIGVAIGYPIANTIGQQGADNTVVFFATLVVLGVVVVTLGVGWQPLRRLFLSLLSPGLANRLDSVKNAEVPGCSMAKHSSPLFKRPLARAPLTGLMLAAASLLLGPSKGLQAEYFSSEQPGATPAMTFTDLEVTDRQMLARWYGSPPPAFSARWFGFLTAPRTGRYTFALTADDAEAIRAYVVHRANEDKALEGR